ncbi:MAG TPA: glycerophosphodiester phosphodiesterase family protein [Ktedonobacterales bacterium]
MATTKSTQKHARVHAVMETTERNAQTPGGVICYAHRGARAYLPENTLPAFELALDLGAEGIECDVQRTHDGELIIIHDATLDRTTNGTGLVAAAPFDVIRALNAGVRKGVRAQVPTLTETLSLARDRGARLNLEIKGESVAESIGTAETVEPVLRALAGDSDEWAGNRLLVSSFELPAVRLLKERLPWLHTAALCAGSEWRGRPAGRDMVAVARELGAEAIHPALNLLTPDLIHRAHEAGLRVNVWTVNLVPSIRRLIALGVDGLFSDFPERVVITRARMAMMEGSAAV